jgi:hypothetical protein
MTTFERIFEKADKVVKSYRTDLDIDRDCINQNPGVPFIHVAREMGTHIVLMPTADTYPTEGEVVPYLMGHADRHHMLDQIPIMVKCVVDNERTIQYFDGHTVKLITAEKAIGLAAEYVKTIRHQWYKARRAS